MDKTITIGYEEYRKLEFQSKLFEDISNSDDLCVCLNYRTKTHYIVKGYDEKLKLLMNDIEENSIEIERLTNKLTTKNLSVGSLIRNHEDEIRKKSWQYQELYLKYKKTMEDKITIKDIVQSETLIGLLLVIAIVMSFVSDSRIWGYVISVIATWNFCVVAYHLSEKFKNDKLNKD